MKYSGIGMLLVLGLGPVLSAESYTFTSLLFPGGNSVASGINDLGTIVGFPGAAQSWVWQNGTYTLLVVGSVFTSATGINVRGDIVGTYSSTGFGNGQGFILQGSVLTPIDFPGLAMFGTFPKGINSRVEIVGVYIGDDSRFHGFLREKDQYTAIDVPFQGASNTEALGINDCGEIVGSYTGSDGNVHGFVKEGSSFHSIDFPGATSTSAAGINNRGEIVGSYTDNSGTHGFIFANGVFTRFDVSFPGISVTRTAAAGINDLGEIVGSYSTSQSVFGFLAQP
jgi:probable HAF family extracellular repeat protein